MAVSAWRTLTVHVAGLESGVAGLCPATTEDRPRWYLATCDGQLLGVDADTGEHFFAMHLPFRFDRVGSAELVATDDGRFVAVVPSTGVTGALIDTSSSTVVKTLERADYHANVSGWALAMVRRNNRDILICATAWNRLEATELPSLEVLVSARDEARLDYFYGRLSSSPSGRYVTSSGWHWHPVGSLHVFDVDAWLLSKATPEMESLVMTEWWDGEVCWLDDHRFALFGDAGDGGENFGDAMPYFNHQSGVALFETQPRKFSGFLPEVTGRGLATDGEHLFVLGAETRAYSLRTQHWLEPSDAETDVWHPGARVALCCPALRGQPGPCVVVWRASWVSNGVPDSVRALAPGSLDATGLSVLGDALEEAGIAGEVVAHCREGRPHGRRCWVVEGL